MPESGGNVIGLEAQGKLTAEDYAAYLTGRTGSPINRFFAATAGRRTETGWSNRKGVFVVEAGQLETVVTYLEMTAPPGRPTVPPPPGKLALLRAERPTISFYRYLYNTIGGPWKWWERRVMDDATLGGIITDPAVEIYVLYLDGVPAGFAELDGRASREVEIAYLGLLEDFIGRGLGWYLLNWAVDVAWTREPRRVWVHTCNLDHPRALSMYQRAGFRVYRQETELIADPAPILGATALPLPGEEK